MRTDGQRDMTKLIAAICSFGEALENEKFVYSRNKIILNVHMHAV
jgi:hypothetical protein